MPEHTQSSASWASYASLLHFREQPPPPLPGTDRPILISTDKEYLASLSSGGDFFALQQNPDMLPEVRAIRGEKVTWQSVLEGATVHSRVKAAIKAHFESKWKFHLSVPAEQLPRAWDLIADYVQQNKLTNIKISTPEQAERFSPDLLGGRPNYQRGKMITLYYADGGPKPEKWQEILQHIETKWAQAGIAPGATVPTDRKVPGGRYIYYRCDRAPDGQYIDPATVADLPEERRYNPHGEEDPFRPMRLSTPPVASPAGKPRLGPALRSAFGAWHS